jgi:hypothetical protein
MGRAEKRDYKRSYSNCVTSGAKPRRSKNSMQNAVENIQEVRGLKASVR